MEDFKNILLQSIDDCKAADACDAEYSDAVTTLYALSCMPNERLELQNQRQLSVVGGSSYAPGASPRGLEPHLIPEIGQDRARKRKIVVHSIIALQEQLKTVPELVDEEQTQELIALLSRDLTSSSERLARALGIADMKAAKVLPPTPKRTTRRLSVPLPRLHKKRLRMERSHSLAFAVVG